MATPETVEMLARDYTFEVNDGTVLAPDWLEIGGLNTWSHSPSSNDADTTKFFDGGRSSHMKASRGDEFSMAGFRSMDDTVTARDPGQLVCESWANAVGRSSRKLFRITEIDTAETRVFTATATVTQGGGGNDDPSTWELSITVTGSIASSSLPAVLAAPTITGAPGTAEVTVDFTYAGTPTQFEVVVTNASSGAELVTVVSTAEPVYCPVAAGSVKVQGRVKNSGGWSVASALSSSLTVS